MSLYNSAALLIALVAVVGYLNHRVLKLPATIGMVLIALVASLLLLSLDLIIPGLQLGPQLQGMVKSIDFNQTLMYGMLSFLLFAGALHMELDQLLERRWVILTLATAGVVLSTTLIGLASYLVLKLLGLGLPLLVCLVFGALISPTDPIAVLGILKSANAPKEIEAIIAGESLFNDGVGVVVFIVLTAIAGLKSSGGASPDAGQVALLFGQEVGGGIVLGLGLGWIAYQALKSIDEYKIEVQITLALVMLITVIAGVLHLSGPIAVVLAGLLLGNHGRQFAMSPQTIEHVETFWELLDEVLNAVLFLLIGLEVFAISMQPAHLAAGVLMIPVALGARYLAVGLPVMVLSRLRSPLPRGTVPVLTWSGLRGGISVALVLSLPPFPGRETILTVTYVVVLFSILAQGLTVRRVVTRLLGAPAAPGKHGVV